ncbi:hypothetical protein [Lentzea jiangxiensis]|uniref:Uncharacterized protein n=1 Tax=Lentzea jiangxiensis TaxID=641025 RepID=A0A1H0F4G4_9PSEU|nr:hypothetical protein [Lentzea jiangxiensis]SDN89471.1 hypothetical protein SAMN05421507_101632 [Lentzea jiangxiensis]
MALRRHAAVAAASGIASTAVLTPTAVAEEAVLPGAGAQAADGSRAVVLEDGARTLRHACSSALNALPKV